MLDDATVRPNHFAKQLLMMPSNSRRCVLLFMLTLMAQPGLALVAQAATVSYEIDSSASYMQLSVTLAQYGLADLVPQSPGADVTPLSGLIVGDWDSGSLTFSSGSTIQYDANPEAPFLPSGSDITVESYGLMSSDLGGSNCIAGDGIGDLTSGTVTDGAPPSNLFWGSHSTYATDGYLASVLGATGTMNGNGLDSSPLLVGLTTVGSIETLTIPLLLLDSHQGVFTQTGVLVATRVVPEPSALTLAALGSVWLLATVAHRRWRLARQAAY